MTYPLKAVRDHLVADPAIAAIVPADRVYLLQARQNAALPYLLISPVSQVGVRSLDAGRGNLGMRVSVDCRSLFVDGANSANALGALALARLDGFSGTIDATFIDRILLASDLMFFEDESRTARRVLDFYVYT